MHGANALSLEALAARQLLEALTDLDGLDVLDMDASVLETAVEGETDFYEAVDATLAALREVEIMIAGITGEVSKLELRRDRVAAKRERLKGMLLAAIETAGVPSPLRRPTATVSVGKGRAAVVLTDEAAIPLTFKKAAPQVDDARHVLISASVTLGLLGRKAEAEDAEGAAAGLAELYQPDRPAIAEAFKSGGAVPGACLSNACPTLSIRVK